MLGFFFLKKSMQKTEIWTDSVPQLNVIWTVSLINTKGHCDTVVVNKWLVVRNLLFKHLHIRTHAHNHGTRLGGKLLFGILAFETLLEATFTSWYKFYEHYEPGSEVVTSSSKNLSSIISSSMWDKNRLATSTNLTSAPHDPFHSF